MELAVRVISPFPAAAIPRVWTWIQEFRGRVSDDFGAKSLAEFVERWESKEQRTWAVYRDDELGGVITFERLSPIAGTAHCVFKKSFWGRKTTLPATAEVARQIFAQGVEKLVFYVFEDNHAIRSLLRELGAKQEGVLRKQTVRNGQRTDVIVMGLLKEEANVGCAGRVADQLEEGAHEHVEQHERRDLEQHDIEDAPA